MTTPRWLTETLIVIAGRGIDTAEVIDVLYADEVVRNDLNTIVYTCGQAGSGRFLVITTERLALPLRTEWITDARLAGPGEIALWRKGFKR